jgi:hypothetical protein
MGLNLLLSYLKERYGEYGGKDVDFMGRRKVEVS